MILSIALANALASASGPVVPAVSSGVSSSTSLMCADSGCVEDMLVGVGGFDGGWVPGCDEVHMGVMKFA